MPPFTGYFGDRFIAPGISGFTDAEIPDMTEHDPESKFWLRNYVLNSGLRGDFLPPGNAYVYNYLRRAEASYSEHEEARQATLAFLASGGQAVSRYAAAVLHWEFFLTQSWQAYLLLGGFFKLLAGEPIKFFAKGDGSVEERLNSLYNSMKHVESRIEASQILEGATVPVWLTNAGIQSTDTLLTYEETADILRDLARWANVVVDPLEMANKVRTSRTEWGQA